MAKERQARRLALLFISWKDLKKMGRLYGNLNQNYFWPKYQPEFDDAGEFISDADRVAVYKTAFKKRFEKELEGENHPIQWMVFFMTLWVAAVILFWVNLAEGKAFWWIAMAITSWVLFVLARVRWQIVERAINAAHADGLKARVRWQIVERAINAAHADELKRLEAVKKPIRRK